MHPPETRAQARRPYLAGATLAEAARAARVSHPTVRHRCKARAEPERQGTAQRCFRCRPGIADPTDLAPYAYLLGVYLGDGHLVTTARVPVLRISCRNRRPGLIDACERAMRAVLAEQVQRVQQPGCVNVQSYGKHWPCLFPQHGPGMTHERPVVLTDWQRKIVEKHAGDFLRGLFHSDGCRFANRVTVRGKAYVYPRYLFTSESSDLMGLCQWALDLLGISWRMTRRNWLSVARRDAVAALDRHVGPRS